MHLLCVHHSYLWFAFHAQYSSHGYGHAVSYSHGLSNWQWLRLAAQSSATLRTR
jgi:hypothetical protein